MQMLGCNGMAEGFFARAEKYNPDMQWLERLKPLVYKLSVEGFAGLVSKASGFAVKPALLKDPERMRPVAVQLRKLAAVLDELLAVYEAQGLS